MVELTFPVYTEPCDCGWKRPCGLAPTWEIVAAELEAWLIKIQIVLGFVPHKALIVDVRP